jgi:hypothetical protein
MYSGRTLFSQVMDFVPWTSFDRIVVKHGGDIGVRTLRCTEHFRINNPQQSWGFKRGTAKGGYEGFWDKGLDVMKE